MGPDVFKTFAALSFVIGLIFVMAWAYRRFLPTGSAIGKEQDGWRILGSRMLGPGRQVVVLEVGAKILLVGLTKENMTPLMEIESEADRKVITEALSTKSSTSFADVLKRTKPA